ncbi:MAG: hypothetical protein JSV21_05710 [Nitrospirota bacterium]|nr:MAG: hypothetical protein JSV21_05710 [Nitrospirota bacterium]
MRKTALFISVLILVMIMSLSVNNAMATDPEKIDEIVDEFREAQEDFTKAIAKSDWKGAEKAASQFVKSAKELAELEEAKGMHSIYSVEVHWLTAQAEEILDLVKEKNAAEAIWDYGTLTTRFQGVMSAIPHYALTEFEEGIEELEEAIEEKDKEEVGEAAERVDEGAMHLMLAAHLVREKFANTRWMMDVHKFIPVEHKVLEASEKGNWEGMDGIIKDAKDLHKKVKFSFKK